MTSKLKTDLAKLDAMTDEDIEAAIKSNPDAAPDMSDALASNQFRVIRPNAPDITTIRARSGLSQKAFAQRYGIDLRALQDWEQGRRQPSKSLQSYLKVIDRNGDMVADTLAMAG